MSILDGLNEKQREAAGCVDGPLLIIAGAGSGKTRTLTHRIAYLIGECGVDPYHIMAITFTNKAAGEMRERVDRIVGEGAESVWVMTFHATCVRILRRHIDQIGYDTSFTIYDTDDSKSVMKAVFKKLQIDPKMLREATVLREISNAKNELMGPDDYADSVRGDYSRKKIADAYQEYQATLRGNNALDFDDLIRMTVELFKRCPEVLEIYRRRFEYIMVDEYQDTNNAQFELVKLLAGSRQNICVVGDDDQSIYKFRGANIMNILNFENVFHGAKVVKLEQNYRSTQNILDAANAVIKNNHGRKSKKLWTDRGNEEPVYFSLYSNGREEAEAVCDEIGRLKRTGKADYKDCAILYRTNAQSREFEEAFVRENIPYYIVGGVNFYSRREIKDVLAYLKTIDNGRDDLAVRRIINVPKRGIGATTVAKVAAYAESRNVDFFTACERAKEIEGLGKAADKVAAFAKMIKIYRGMLTSGGISYVIEQLLDETGFTDEIRNADEDDAEERIENVDELVTRIHIYEEEHPEGSLSEFLEEVALVSDLDNADAESSRVMLMTVHSAKGLEFPRVFLVGMEDGIFPGYMAINSESREDIEEERRLAYVAITRAMDVLKISAARARMVRGEMQYNALSRFIKEIPEELLSGGSSDIAWRAPSGRNTDTRPERRRFAPPVSDTDSEEDMARLGQIYAARKAAREKEKAEKKPVVLTKGADLAVEKPDYAVGDRVAHIKYGQGEVLAIEPGPKDYQVTVRFDEAGQKIMFAKFARLVKV